VQFIQESSFTSELDGMANGQSDDLLLRVEQACWYPSQIVRVGYGFVRVDWNATAFLVWYCVNGDAVTLLSIISARP